MAPAPFLAGLSQTSAPGSVYSNPHEALRAPTVTRPDTVDPDRSTLQQRYELLLQHDKDRNDFIGVSMVQLLLYLKADHFRNYSHAMNT